MKWVIRQLKQPSTWKGFFILAGLVGYSIDPALQEQIIIAVTAIIAAIEIYRNEHKPQPVNVVLPPIELVSTHLSEKEVKTVSERPTSRDYYPIERLRGSMPTNDGTEQSGFGDR